MDGVWMKSLANVPKITEDVLLRYLVERVSHIHQSEKQQRRPSLSRLAHFSDMAMLKNARVQVTHE
jgi:hypothetical protein